MLLRKMFRVKLSHSDSNRACNTKNSAKLLTHSIQNTSLWNRQNPIFTYTISNLIIDVINFSSKLPSFDVHIMAMGQEAFDSFCFRIRSLQSMSHKMQESSQHNG